MKYLIVGLGNIGPEYVNTRHNIGFDVLDALAKASNISFKDKRFGFKAELKHKSRIFILIKPSTYMNRSGTAVRYWLKKEEVPLENLLVVADDISLPFGTLRIRPKGGDAGHKGISNIIQVLGTQNFARLRIGIGNDYSRGRQVDFVLGEWEEKEVEKINEKIIIASDIIKSYGTIGLEFTMNQFNMKGD